MNLLMCYIIDVFKSSNSRLETDHVFVAALLNVYFLRIKSMVRRKNLKKPKSNKTEEMQNIKLWFNQLSKRKIEQFRAVAEIQFVEVLLNAYLKTKRKSKQFRKN